MINIIEIPGIYRSKSQTDDRQLGKFFLCYKTSVCLWLSSGQWRAQSGVNLTISLTSGIIVGPSDVFSVSFFTQAREILLFHPGSFQILPLSLSLSHTHTHTHIHTHTHTHLERHSNTQKHTHTHTHLERHSMSHWILQKNSESYGIKRRTMVSTVSYSAPNLTAVLPLDYGGKQCVDGVTA